MNTAAAFATIPLSWYVSDEIFAAENARVFAASPRYVGAVPLVPGHGSYHTLAQRDHAEMLMREHDEIRLLGNICLHRSMQMFQGDGATRVIVCPMHRWTYELSGRLTGAPHYTPKPCMTLPRERLWRWNGLLFGGERDVSQDLAPLAGRPELDISGYVPGQREQEEQAVNWKIPVEVLLENYHVPVIHPGLTRYVDPSTWFGNDGGFDSERLMFQEMRPHPDFAHNPASPVFEAWQQAILKISGGRAPASAAIIALLFPNIFLEWYPYNFVATTYVPRAPGRSLMLREFFYDPQALAIVPEYPALTKAAWDENQAADDIAHAALQRGRELRYRTEPDGPSGVDEYQSPTEDSVKLFHDALKRMME